MFRFYYQNSDSFTRWVQDKLEDMVVAHEIIDVGKQSSYSLPNGISHDNLPLLSDNHERWTSKEKIHTFLEKLDQDLQFSRSLTSDSCYTDPENPSECL
ncbi:hypothetical protein [Fodinibius sp.]|uniref:hypothetical protein n=1 Tax=Fodinibius sp. TaxID=1872440 RepID=UPI002ACD6E71|nr:hypothetical protein [Fodinibius sp.]MDZ7659724.1 hypothetical protein [Fodinibius sp.]